MRRLPHRRTRRAAVEPPLGARLVRSAEGWRRVGKGEGGGGGEGRASAGRRGWQCDGTAYIRTINCPHWMMGTVQYKSLIHGCGPQNIESATFCVGVSCLEGIRARGEPAWRPAGLHKPARSARLCGHGRGVVRPVQRVEPPAAAAGCMRWPLPVTPRCLCCGGDGVRVSLARRRRRR